MATMRAKLVVNSVTQSKSDDGRVLSEVVKFNAVGPNAAYPEDGSDEDNTYARWSPSASFEITIANPALFGQFELGKKFYSDFSPAD